MTDRKKYRMRIRGYFECEARNKKEALDIFAAIVPEHDFNYSIDSRSCEDNDNDYEIITEEDWFDGD